MKADNNRKYLLIFSGILLGFQYLGFVIDVNIPFTQIKVSSQANIPIVLTILIIYFGGQFTFYWLRQKKEERIFFDFITSIPLALFAIASVCYSYLKEFGIDWKVITLTILIMLLGGLLGIAVEFTIAIIFSLRSQEEMKKMGLGKIPSASKAFIRCLFFLIPLNAAIILLLATYQYLLPAPLNNYWFIFYLIPTILLNFYNFKNLLLCLGPSKVRKKALAELHLFREAMDLHEMHYQFIGLEKYKKPEVPPICAFARDGKLDALQDCLSSGADPNTQDGRGWCPLMWASAEGRLATVELLLENGANPNVINYLGRSAIMYASNYGFYRIVKALLEKGAIPNPSDEFTDHPPLSAAAHRGYLEVVKLLVEHGANVMHKSKDNETALDIAMAAGHGDVAKYLRNKMLELDETPPEDKTNLIKNLDWIGKKNDAARVQKVYRRGESVYTKKIMPKKLTTRKSFTFPEDTTVAWDDELLSDFLDTWKLKYREPDFIVLTLELNGEKHDFSYSEFEILVACLADSTKTRYQHDAMLARFEFAAALYVRRYPY